LGRKGSSRPKVRAHRKQDIYSLGKVLYEIATAKIGHDFPELPTMLGEDSSDTQLLELNSVFLKACQSDVKLRYKSAEEMRDDLLLLQSGKSVKRAQETERRLATLMRISTVGVSLILIALTAILYFNHQAKKETALRLAAQQNLIAQYVGTGESTHRRRRLDGCSPLVCEGA
jgi:serine/threonine protein kinase